MLAYFGFPRVERAVRVALDIVALVAKLETAAKNRLDVGIGISTGHRLDW